MFPYWCFGLLFFVVFPVFAENTSKDILVLKDSFLPKENFSSKNPASSKESVSSKEELIQSFQQQMDRLKNDLDKVLEDSKKNKLASQKNILMDIAEKNIIPFWDCQVTLISLIGHSHWKQATSSQKKALLEAFKQTIIRYFIEAYEHYRGHQFHVTALELNTKQTKGWLRLKVLKKGLPTTEADLHLTRRTKKWLFSDTRILGMRYSHLKRMSYLLTISLSGIDGLIQELQNKNKQFFSSQK